SNRRDFLKTSTMATSALLLSSLDGLASLQTPTVPNKNRFAMKILATDWGFPGTLEEFLKKVKSEGYDGIEAWLPTTEEGKRNLFSLLKKYELEAGFLCAGSGSDWQEHFGTFKTATQTATQSVFVCELPFGA
ncbi:MAG: twin-arginine translocation signal domain-containing protein, partial [Sphingobacterium sp.]